MSTGMILFIIGLFYFAAHAFSYVFQKTKVPDVLILMIIGVLLGPTTGLVHIEDFGRLGPILTVITLTVILFESGTALRLETMGSAMGSTLALTLATSVVTFILVTVGSVGYFDGDWRLAFITGAILAGTSSAVVIPMVKALKLTDKVGTILVLESAITDVISIVLTFGLLTAFQQENVSASGMVNEIFASFIFATVIGLIGGIFWLFIWEKVRAIPNSVLTTVAFAFMLYGLSENFGFSGAIASLAFGVTLANGPDFFKDRELPRISNTEREIYSEGVFLLKTFFFIYLGLSVRLPSLKEFFFAVLVILAIYFCRIWITRFTLTRKGSTLHDALMTSVLIPKGLAAAVLGSFAGQSGIENAQSIQSIVFTVVVITIIVTSVLVPMLERTRLRVIYSKILAPFAVPSADSTQSKNAI